MVLERYCFIGFVDLHHSISVATTCIWLQSLCSLSMNKCMSYSHPKCVTHSALTLLSIYLDFNNNGQLNLRPPLTKSNIHSIFLNNIKIILSQFFLGFLRYYKNQTLFLFFLLCFDKRLKCVSKSITKNEI